MNVNTFDTSERDTQKQHVFDYPEKVTFFKQAQNKYLGNGAKTSHAHSEDTRDF